jgi:hypothetical protein
MTCVHLQQLFRLCHEHDLKLGGSDLIRVVCNQCGEQEVCPSTLTDEYDAKQSRLVNDRSTIGEKRAEDPAR